MTRTKSLAMTKWIIIADKKKIRKDGKVIFIPSFLLMDSEHSDHCETFSNRGFK